MNLKMRYVCIVLGMLLFSTCKKEYKIVDNSNPGVTMFGDGREHFLNEVIETADHNFILGGTTLNGANGMFDYYALKVDQNFNIVWYKNFGGVYEDVFYSMAQDDEGNILMAGNSFSFGASIDSSNGNQSTEFYLVYINKDGNIIWEKSFQSNPNKQNFDNRSKKIIYLHNNSFAVMGETSNYSGNGGEYDVFGYCIDKQSNLKWTRRFFNVPIPSYSLEYCQNAILSEDRNIIFQIRNDSNYTPMMRLAKTSINGTGHTNNLYLWKGPVYSDFLANTLIQNNQAVYTILPMASCGGDRVAIADYATGELILTKDDGSLLKRVAFKNFVTISDITKLNEKLLIFGVAKLPEGDFPVIISTTLNGDILKETYLNKNSDSNPLMTYYKVFKNDKNEFVVFGTINTKKGSNIVMLKYDFNGNLIIK